MNKKILIDYEEYNRLTRAASLCEELLKNKDGKGSLSQIIAENERKNALQPPIAEEIGSITIPLDGTLEVPKVSTNPTKKKRHSNKQPQTDTYIKDQWFFIGKPST